MTAAAPDSRLSDWVQRERAALERAIRHASVETTADLPASLADPLRYVLDAGGKRLRALLFLRAWQALADTGDLPDGAYRIAAAIEAIHTYSLVHDDLPCMDDDDLRRGRPTTHRVYGVARAALAGLALIPIAARWVARGAGDAGLDSTTAARLVRELMLAAGAAGMVGGQVLDLRADGGAAAHGLPAVQLEEARDIHVRKTGALFQAPLRMGGIAAGADAAAIATLDRFGALFGLAFQIADDILDESAEAAVLGKSPGKDRAQGKVTFVTLLGLDRARARAAEYARAARRELHAGGLEDAILDALARFAVERDR